MHLYLIRETAAANRTAIFFYDSRNLPPFSPSNSISPTDRPHPEVTYYRMGTTYFNELVNSIAETITEPRSNLRLELVRPPPDAPAFSSELCSRIPTPDDSQQIQDLITEARKDETLILCWTYWSDENGKEQKEYFPLCCLGIMRENLYLYVTVDVYAAAMDWLTNQTDQLDPSLRSLARFVHQDVFKHLLWTPEQGLGGLQLFNGFCMRSALSLLGSPLHDSRISRSTMDDLLELFLRTLPAPSPFILVPSFWLSLDSFDHFNPTHQFNDNPLIVSVAEVLREHPQKLVVVPVVLESNWGGRIIDFSARKVTIVGAKDQSFEPTRHTLALFSFIKAVEVEVGKEQPPPTEELLPFDIFDDPLEGPKAQSSDGGVELIADLLSRFAQVGSYDVANPGIWFEKMKMLITLLAAGHGLNILKQLL